MWIHDGNSGDFSTVDLATGVRTPRFTLGYGAQGFTFRRDNGNLLLAVAFFNPGGMATGTVVELDLLGNVVATGGATGQTNLVDNADACLGVAGTFNIVNGMTWVASLEMLAISAFLPTNGRNVALFAPQSSAFLGRYGQDTLHGDGLPFHAAIAGDAVLGGPGFTITLEDLDPFALIALPVSLLPDCVAPPLGGGNLLVNVSPSLATIQVFAQASSTLALPLPLTGVPRTLDVVDFFFPFATLGGSAAGQPITSAGLRIHLH